MVVNDGYTQNAFFNLLGGIVAFLSNNEVSSSVISFSLCEDH